MIFLVRKTLSKRLFNYLKNYPKLRVLISENNDSELKSSNILGVLLTETNETIAFNFKEIAGTRFS